MGVARSFRNRSEGSLRQAVAYELRRSTRKPYESLLTVMANALLATGGWFLLPNAWKEHLFNVHRPMAFAVVLATWMYADVPSTNVFAGDAAQALKVLGKPREMLRMIDARTAVLGFLIAPICVTVSVVTGIKDHEPLTALMASIWIVVAPLGFMGLAPCLGVLFPYHPQPLAFRWERRRQFGASLRWVLLITAPYFLVPALAGLVLLPGFLAWGVKPWEGFASNLSELRLGVGIALTVTSSFLAAFVGRKVMLKLLVLRHEQLEHYLAHPDLG
ncbi:MAG: hypothetical protein WCO31_03325 [Actinomycetes bacterium]